MNNTEQAEESVEEEEEEKDQTLRHLSSWFLFVDDSEGPHWPVTQVQQTCS